MFSKITKAAKARNATRRAIKKFCFQKKPKISFSLANNGAKVRHGVSLLETRTLDKLEACGIRLERSKVIILFGKTYVVDGYHALTNTIYEINGSYWHGDLRVYKPNDINTLCNKTMFMLNYETKAKYQIWKDCGFTVKYAWEYDLKKGNLLFHTFRGINYPL